MLPDRAVAASAGFGTRPCGLRRPARHQRFLWLLGAYAGLGGCAVSARGPVYLQNGERSIMVRSGVQLRNRLVPVAAPGVALVYRSASCTYEQRQSGADGRVEHQQLKMSIDAIVGDRLFVESVAPDGEATAIMDQTGLLLITNGMTPDRKDHVNDQNFDEKARQDLRTHRLGSHWVNHFAELLPHFLGVPRYPGVRVADSVFGTYIYRGTLRYHGVQAELFDLMRHAGDHDVVSGFLLFDTQNVMPLLFHQTAGVGRYVEIEQVRCQGR